ncbi:uncharacterized protein EDB91DRAFT_1106124 [Suillus paluster]|uniref:uncharacterized protein n=1 Tax=Suillus paluster TaxID=48578 RepID=UPI001B876DC4|nr:uncharacterized protein EDB91DRAFT_1106124 [Suillus paluster]KAG1751582.1 hypothetical protein EDB91DRAFT_1106124 [Suillus paluster]
MHTVVRNLLLRLLTSGSCRGWIRRRLGRSTWYLLMTVYHWHFQYLLGRPYHKAAGWDRIRLVYVCIVARSSYDEIGQTMK